MAETDLKKLYAGRILELAADIPLSERLAAPMASVKKRSPLCGSTVCAGLSTGQCSGSAGEDSGL